MKTRALAATFLGVLALSASAYADTFNYTGSLQTFVAPSDAIYDVWVFGASGGDFVGADYTNSGGRGAATGAEFQLYAGEVLTILVGGVGADATSSGGAGGGGGSFVLDPGYAPLVVAGGGGGAGGFINILGVSGAGIDATWSSSNGVDGNEYTKGGSLLMGGLGGVGGLGGGVSPSTPSGGGGGGGGGGVLGSGASGPAHGGGGVGFPVGISGTSLFADGSGAGGLGVGTAGTGGFGGGGGGGISAGGGGGGSYWNTALQYLGPDAIALEGWNNGAGQVQINLRAVPEPSALGIFGVGLFLALTTMHTRRRRASPSGSR